jgi:ribosomal protein S18 acetylase RimI-like enzyme
LRPLCRMNLRTANVEDFDFLYGLRRAAMKEYVARTYGWDEAWQRENFRRHFDPSASRIIVSQGRDAGVLSVSETESEIVLNVVELLPEFQGRGIGTAVVRWVLEDAEGKGKAVKLQVLKVNPARRLYERLGFSTVGETETHYLMRATPAGAS